MPNNNQFGQTNGSFLSFLPFTSFFHPISSALPYTNPHPLSRAPSFCLDPIISKNFPYSSCLSAFEARGFRTIILVCSKYVREDRGLSSLKQPAMQSQLVCSGCRSILLYPGGATNVCCALCNAITSVPPPGMEMTQLICGGCRTPLMYTRGATSVRCSCCHTVNLAPVSSQVAHVSCGNCRTTLMYPYGAPSVKCAVCHYVTNVGISNTRVPIPVHRPNGTANSGTVPFGSTSQTVVVENPMTVDESGKLVSSVVVGVTTDKK